MNNELLNMLRHQEQMMRIKGANGLADLFMNAANEITNKDDRITELERELKERNRLLEIERLGRLADYERREHGKVLRSTARKLEELRGWKA